MPPLPLVGETARVGLAIRASRPLGSGGFPNVCDRGKGPVGPAQRPEAATAECDRSGADGAIFRQRCYGRKAFRNVTRNLNRTAVPFASPAISWPMWWLKAQSSRAGTASLDRSETDIDSNPSGGISDHA